MKTISILLVAALISVSVPVQAQKMDVSTVKCRDFVNSGKENIALILMWLQGYYADEDASPIVDFDKMGEDARKLGDYCSKNPDHSIITAADEVVDE